MGHFFGVLGIPAYRLSEIFFKGERRRPWEKRKEKEGKEGGGRERERKEEKGRKEGERERERKKGTGGRRRFT